MFNLTLIFSAVFSTFLLMLVVRAIDASASSTGVRYQEVENSDLEEDLVSALKNYQKTQEIEKIKISNKKHKDTIIEITDHDQEWKIKYSDPGYRIAQTTKYNYMFVHRYIKNEKTESIKIYCENELSEDKKHQKTMANKIK